MSRLWFRLSFASTALVLFLTAASLVAGDFDGRLPAGAGDPVDSNGLVPFEAQPFMARYPGHFYLYWDYELRTPRYLSPRVATPGLPPFGGAAIISEPDHLTLARTFLADNSIFFGVSASNWELADRRQLGSDRLFYFRQKLNGIPIRGANVRVCVRQDGSLGPIKCYALRESLVADIAAAAFPSFVDSSVVAQNVVDLGHHVQSVDRQYVFSEYSSASINAIWRVRFHGDGGPSGEIFADPATGDLIEERHFFFELGVLRGRLEAVYPDPQDSDALFQTPADMIPGTFFPVLGAEISGGDIDVTDEDGEFSLTHLGFVNNLNWNLRRTQCTLPEILQLPGGEPKFFCSGNTNVLDFAVGLDLTGSCGQFDIVEQKPPPPANEMLDEFLVLQFNRDETLIHSAAMMSYVQGFKFPAHYQNEVKRLIDVLDDDVDLPDNNASRINFDDLEIEIQNSQANVIRYEPERNGSDIGRICISHELTVDGVGVQPLTPTILNHEIAHHIHFRITGALRSVFVHCFGDDSRRCVGEKEDERKEVNFIEGIVDAMAAYGQVDPRFGFSDGGDRRNALSYDLSLDDASDPRADSIRILASRLFWQLRQPLTVQGKTLLNGSLNNDLPEALLYNWIAANVSIDGTGRTFELSPFLIDEILDTDDSLSKINEGADRDRRNGTPNGDLIIEIFRQTEGLTRAAFVRGDANEDGRVNIADPVFILNFIFTNTVETRCLDALDANNDHDRINVADPIYLLGFVFQDTPPPPAPFPGCGVDPGPSSDDWFLCLDYEPCELP